MEAANRAFASTSSLDIVDALLSAGHFKILSNAIIAADLVGTLKGKGPFTVFAPTDDAFNRLPAGTVDGLLKDKVKLAAILKHYVISGISNVKGTRSGDAKIVNADRFNVSASSAGIAVENAKVNHGDIDATNGLIHIIDRLVLPH